MCFLEYGAPDEVLVDNATSFHARPMAALMARWGVRLRFRGAYEASGNGVVERNHRTVKVMVARQGCSVPVAVHRYNTTPTDTTSEETAPLTRLMREPGRDLPVSASVDPSRPAVPPPSSRPGSFAVGDLVWFRRRGITGCMDRSRPGVVTQVLPPPMVEVNGIPWHRSNVRHRFTCDRVYCDSLDDDDGVPLHVGVPTEGAERPVPTEPSAPSMQHDDGGREAPQVHDASRMSEFDVSLDDSADADYVPSDSGAGHVVVLG